MCGFTDLPELNGLKVRDFLDVVQTLLGGGTATYSIVQLDPIAQNLNVSFQDGFKSQFAADHLVNGACP
ncbi:MAG TPA: hypothetical protein VFW66_12980 [Gemmatimonadales bacterium]|nr:hypothetical protein [Gemmatimonadales bacterium]